ncbi:MAG: M1 family metallopeptidase [Candidatus Thorarchaeota archaeon]
MKSKLKFPIILFISFFCINNFFNLIQLPQNLDKSIEFSNNSKNDFKVIPKLSFNNTNFSYYNLSISFDPISSSVTGNLTVDYYNNDPLNFTKIPFHLFLSGMLYYTRIGSIEILNVTTLNIPRTALYFEVNESAQLLWVYLGSELEPYHRINFEIKFKSIIPDGSTEIGFDRAGSYGSDTSQSRIYKFSAFYPMPCVYDKYDGWNTDPYLWVGDPFYYDMAYYNLFLEAPKDYIIAATGELITKTDKGATNLYHFSPILPVREVTFSASKWFIVESNIVKEVNVSVYYIPKSQLLWHTYALTFAIQALTLFNDTFGEYVYPTFNVVEEYTDFGGMEYPCQVYITEVLDEWSYPFWWLESIIVHETSHQWWYNLVGNDEIDWGFLDEGLACWSTSYYAEIIYGDWEYFQYTRYIDRVRTYYTIEGLPSRINASVYDAVHADNYYFTGYYKAPLILEKLRKTIGDTIFLNGLKLYFTQEVYKIALLSDLQLAMESVYGSSLDWFFFPWFDNQYLPKYNFLEYTYYDSQQILQLTINDLNEPLNDYSYSQQVELLIYDSNGLAYDEWIWINGTTTMNISLINKPKRLRLEYGDEVLVQLYSEDITYLEKSLEKPPFIPGYDLSILFLICFVPVALIIYKTSGRMKKNL